MSVFSNLSYRFIIHFPVFICYTAYSQIIAQHVEKSILKWRLPGKTLQHRGFS